jgi:hypothetical protein
MLKIVPDDDDVVRRVAAIDAEIIAESQRLDAVEDAGMTLSFEELAAMAERDIERSRYLVAHGVIPAVLLERAIRRHRRIQCLMARER